MSYYPDLSKRHGRYKAFLVGWLDAGHAFETARPAKWLVEKLWEHCAHVFNPAGGFHECDLPDCPGPARKFRDGYHGAKRSKREIYQSLARHRESMLGWRRGRLPKLFLYNQLAMLDQALRNELRGYSRMIYGVHPRTGERIDLGFAEILVFGDDGRIYAAPNMLFHYVTVHHYKPPNQFLEALKSCPCPPQPEYLTLLTRVGFPAKYVQAYAEFWKKRQIRRNAKKPKST